MKAGSATHWTLSIGTLDGVTDSAETLERFADRLESNGTARGPAASLNTLRMALSATFQVEATSEGQAANRGINAFADALQAAGVESRSLRIEIDPFVAKKEPVPA